MTKQAFVADEQLGVIARRVHELTKRVLSGSLDPARVAAGLQQIIEDKMPEDGIVVPPDRKHWASIRDVREFGEPRGYSRTAIGYMYGRLVQGVSREAWPIEHRGSRYGSPSKMEFECGSLLKFLRSDEFTTAQAGWGGASGEILLTWLDQLEYKQHTEGRLIEELSLGPRSYNCLKRISINTVGDLIQKSATNLEALHPNLGKTSLREIEAALQEHDLQLRTD